VPLPGLLIEYLITGATAFLWLWFLFHHPQTVVPTDLRLDRIDAATITLGIPFAYVLGMIIDFVSLRVTEALLRRLLRPLQRTISKTLPKGWQKLKRASEPRKRSKAPLSQQEVLLASAELAKQFEMRSSRDRVARGAFLNTLLGTAVVSSYYAAKPQTQVSSMSILVGGLVLASLLFAMWLRFDRLTHKYRQKAGEAILKKGGTANLHQTEALPNTGATT
jgi:hypothetical protein